MKEIEINELLEVLNDAGLAELIDCLLDAEVYTKGGRIKRSVISRKLGWSAKRVDEALDYARTLLRVATS